MHEKKQPEKTKVLPELTPSVTEVLVVSGRSFQPFIRTFSYVGENISKSNLGTLLGVFEIDDQSEDSAYIVNFLASVAKKEYFNNPRRGAIESFEAALHKINLALAELVKHGNITWLGKFHGALGVLEKNNLHFSVTGQAKILLSRNDTVADISIGLASEESSLHPIKTFVEVSSGRLASMDQILLCSPELLALFSLDELSKHAARMDHERFTQLLKTALVNELDMAGLMIIDVTENTTLPTENKKTKGVTPLRTTNVFSQSAFLPKKTTEPSSIKEVLAEEYLAKEEEYIDTKTGHIYVQGETPETPGEHPLWEQFSLGLHETIHALGKTLSSQKKWIHRSKKQLSSTLSLVGEQSQTLFRKIGRFVRRKWRKQQAAKKAALLKAMTVPAPTLPSIIAVTDIASPASKNIPLTEIPRERAKNENPAAQEKHALPTPEETLDGQLPQFMKEKLAIFYQRQTSSITSQITETAAIRKNFISQGEHIFTLSVTFLKKHTARTGVLALHLFRSLTDTCRSFYQNLSLRHKQLILGGLSVFLSLTLLGSYFLMRNTPLRQSVTTPEETPVTASSANSKNHVATEITTVLNDVSGNIITSLVLNSETYAITEKTIISITENESFSIPGNSRARFAAAMNDLRLIFIYTESGNLYAFSPISKTFVENTLTLGGETRVAGIGTYLTYLYILDSATDQVYRFPRADGGFGTGVPWIKDRIPIEDNARIAVNETIFISPDATTIQGFFRGRASATLEAPADRLHITALYTYPGLANVYALDRDSKRILVWNQTGKLINELSNDRLSEATSLSVNEKQNEIFITTADSLLSLKLK